MKSLIDRAEELVEGIEVDLDKPLAVDIPQCICGSTNLLGTGAGEYGCMDCYSFEQRIEED